MSRFFNTTNPNISTDFAFELPDTIFANAINAAAGQVEATENSLYELEGQLQGQTFGGNWSKKLQGIFEGYEGDIQNVIEDLRKNPLEYRGPTTGMRDLGKTISKDFQFGEVANLTGEYSKVQAYNTRINKLSDEGKIDPRQVGIAKNMIATASSKEPEWDPVTGVGTSIPTPNIPEMVQKQDMVSDFITKHMSTWAATGLSLDANGEVVVTPGSGWQYIGNNKWENVIPGFENKFDLNDVEKVVRQYMLTDPKISNYDNFDRQYDSYSNRLALQSYEDGTPVYWTSPGQGELGDNKNKTTDPNLALTNLEFQNETILDTELALRRGYTMTQKRDVITGATGNSGESPKYNPELFTGHQLHVYNEMIGAHMVDKNPEEFKYTYVDANGQWITDTVQKDEPLIVTREEPLYDDNGAEVIDPITGQPVMKEVEYFTDSAFAKFNYDTGKSLIQYNNDFLGSANVLNSGISKEIIEKYLFAPAVSGTGVDKENPAAWVNWDAMQKELNITRTDVNNALYKDFQNLKNQSSKARQHNFIMQLREEQIKADPDGWQSDYAKVNQSYGLTLQSGLNAFVEDRSVDNAGAKEIEKDFENMATLPNLSNARIVSSSIKGAEGAILDQLRIRLAQEGRGKPGAGSGKMEITVVTDDGYNATANSDTRDALDALIKIGAIEIYNDIPVVTDKGTYKDAIENGINGIGNKANEILQKMQTVQGLMDIGIGGQWSGWEVVPNTASPVNSMSNQLIDFAVKIQIDGVTETFVFAQESLHDNKALLDFENKYQADWKAAEYVQTIVGNLGRDYTGTVSLVSSKMVNGKRVGSDINYIPSSQKVTLKVNNDWIKNTFGEQADIMKELMGNNIVEDNSANTTTYFFDLTTGNIPGLRILAAMISSGELPY